MSIGMAGSLESNDCLITIKAGVGIVVEIDSIVKNQFGDAIDKIIRETLNELKVKNIHVICNDKGALDYTIRARLITAFERSKNKS